MESANPVTASSTDHFASRFPHHSRIEEKPGLKLQASNVAMAKVLVKNTNSLNSLSDELSRFSMNKPQHQPTSVTVSSPSSVVNVNKQAVVASDPLPISTTTTTIPYSNVPLSMNDRATETTIQVATNNDNNSTSNGDHPQKTNPNQATISQRIPANPLGATKKIIHHQRHLVPVKAQSIDISEVQYGEHRNAFVITPSLSEEEQEYDVASAAACDTDGIARSLSSEPVAASIKGMISKIKSLDSMRPIYPNVPYSPYGSPFSSPKTFRRTTRPPLRESRRISIEQSGSFLQLNQYKLLDQIGQGSYGLVKLAYSEEDSTHYAMKILSKRKLLRRAGLMGRGPKKAISPLDRVYREIAVLKKVNY